MLLSSASPGFGQKKTGSLSTGPFTEPIVPASDGSAATSRGAGATFEQTLSAAQAGDIQSQVRLGQSYEYGIGGADKSLTEAMKWFRRAAEQGSRDAQSKIGYAYREGNGVPKDLRESVRWHRKAADQGHLFSQLALALAYRTGSGVPMDKKNALRWCEESAEGGYRFAQYILAEMHESGESGVQDINEAIHWYTAAAENGDVLAQAKLGQLYARGQYVSRDPIEAARWYQKAADQDLYSAQHELARMYAAGEGVPKDDVEAYKWLELAMKNPHTKGMSADPYFKDQMTAATEEHLTITHRLTQEQVAEAKRRAAVFKPVESGPSVAK